MSGQTLARLAIHGGNQEDQQLEINGMDVGDSLTQGANYSVFPDSNFEEIAYNYSSSPAEIESGGVRINMIPREGANQFSGHFFTTFTSPGLNADNVDDELRAGGLETGTFVDEVWTINPVVGGPIVQDRLWFFLGHTTQIADTLPANTFFADTPPSLDAPFYAPGDIPALDATTIHEQSLNLTFQATTKDKIKAYWTNSSTDQPHLLQGRTLASIFVAPEASIDATIRTNTYQAAWTRPQTNRILFEAGVSHMPVRYVLGSAAEANVGIPGHIQVPGTIASRNQSPWFSGATNRNSPKHTNMVRASMSYVTGSHNMKFGMTGLWLGENAINFSDNDWQRQIVIAGLGPINATFYTPRWEINRARNMGLYAQEQWTLDRLTINAGLRYDYEASSYPDQVVPEAIWQPFDAVIDGQTSNGWHDLQPRIGIAYDLTGDGKTALKFGAFRYGKRNSTDVAKILNPALNNSSLTRTFNDGRDGVCIGSVNCIFGDGLVQGDPLNPVANGELLNASTNPAFGQPIISTTFDQDWAFGYGQRPANWEIAASIQREIRPGLSVDFGYFRRTWVSFWMETNQAVGPEDYDRASLPIPVDPRLPGGGGGTVDFYDIKPGSITVPQTVFTGVDNFGGETQMWQGFDLTVDGRLQNLLIQGGMSTGREHLDNCSRFLGYVLDSSSPNR